MIGAVAVQADFSIVGAGASNGSVAVVRLTPGGAVDPTFGNGGATILSAISTRSDLGEPDHTQGLAIDADGNIVVTNRANGNGVPAGAFRLSWHPLLRKDIPAMTSNGKIALVSGAGSGFGAPGRDRGGAGR